MALKLELRAGIITDLEMQPKFDLIVNGQKVCRYIADFRYERNGEVIIHDAKGYRTKIYRLKKKLMAACLNIEIFET